jgi:predicted N-acetyltransferase YhbS
MPDLLVRLYTLPEPTKKLKKGCQIRRAAAYDKAAILQWIGKNFSPQWASEADVAFSRQPISCLIALQENKVVGFACYETTYRGFFGPMGVVAAHRRQGIGTGLLLSCLGAMKEIGYAYAMIGGVAKKDFDFYRKAIGATEIPDSTPGMYTAPLAD